MKPTGSRLRITGGSANKSLSASVLDEIPNLGPKRKQALLQHFGSIEAIREASLDGLLSVKGIPRSVAENIRKHL